MNIYEKVLWIARELRDSKKNEVNFKGVSKLKDIKQVTFAGVNTYELNKIDFSKVELDIVKTSNRLKELYKFLEYDMIRMSIKLNISESTIRKWMDYGLSVNIRPKIKRNLVAILGKDIIQEK